MDASYYEYSQVNVLSDIRSLIFSLSLFFLFPFLSSPLRFTIDHSPAFKKIHDLLGGRVKAIFSGSAPLDPSVMQFARAAMGAYVMEGYGQTECSGVAVVQLIGMTRTNSRF